MGGVRPRLFFAAYCLSALGGAIALSVQWIPTADLGSILLASSISWFFILLLMSALGVPVGLGLAYLLEEKGVSSRWVYALIVVLLGSVPFLLFGANSFAVAGGVTGLLTSQSFWEFGRETSDHARARRNRL